MPRKKSKKLVPELESNFPFTVVRERVEHALESIPWGSGKDLAAALGMTGPELSKHRGAQTMSLWFHFEELGRIASWLERALGIDLPLGWPFVSEEAWKGMLQALRLSGTHRK